jgi:hypothetical protein
MDGCAHQAGDFDCPIGASTVKHMHIIAPGAGTETIGNIPFFVECEDDDRNRKLCDPRRIGFGCRQMDLRIIHRHDEMTSL